jgi:streptogramin lyase
MIAPDTAAASFTASPPAHSVRLQVVREAVNWRIFPPPQGDDGIYVGIVTGPDGAIWLTDYRGRLVRIDAQGSRTTFPLRFTAAGVTHAFLPAYMTVGADAKFYLTGCVDVSTNCAFIGVADTSGRLGVYPIPRGKGARFSGIAPGPDGDVWFTDSASVDKISPSGVVTAYGYPSGEMTNQLSGIAAGSDGKMWFAEIDRLLVGNVDPKTGKVVEYSTVSQNIDCGLSGMAAASDGNVYAACGQGFVGVSPAGSMTYYESFFTLSDGAQEIAGGAKGTLWCQFLSETGRFDPAQNLLIMYTPPDGALTLYGSATAPDSTQWTLAEDGTVYVLPAPPAAVR